jgi:hypothetical protein
MILSFSFIREIMNIPRDKKGENQYMLVVMSKKMYKEMVKKNEHNCIVGGAISTTMRIRGM